MSRIVRTNDQIGELVDKVHTALHMPSLRGESMVAVSGPGGQSHPYARTTRPKYTHFSCCIVFEMCIIHFASRSARCKRGGICAGSSWQSCRSVSWGGSASDTPEIPPAAGR